MRQIRGWLTRVSPTLAGAWLVVASCSTQLHSVFGFGPGSWVLGSGSVVRRKSLVHVPLACALARWLVSLGTFHPVRCRVSRETFTQDALKAGRPLPPPRPPPLAGFGRSTPVRPSRTHTQIVSSNPPAQRGDPDGACRNARPLVHRVFVPRSMGRPPWLDPVLPGTPVAQHAAPSRAGSQPSIPRATSAVARQGRSRGLPLTALR